MSRRFPSLGLHGIPESRIGQELDNVDKEKQDKKHKQFSAAPKAVDVGEGQFVIVKTGTVNVYTKINGTLYKSANFTAV